MRELADGRALSRALLTELKQDRTLQQILNDIAPRAGMSVYVLDLNNRVLMYSQGPSDGPFWDEAIERGSLPESLFRREQNPGQKLVRMFGSGQGTLFEPGEIDECFYACTPLSADGQADGFLAVRFAGREDAAFGAELSGKLAELYGYFSNREISGVRCAGDFLRAYISRELLLYDGSAGGFLPDGSYPSRPDGVPEIVYRLRPGYRIAAFRVCGPGDAEERLALAESELLAAVPKSFCLISSQILLALFFGLADTPEAARAPLPAQLEAFCRKRRLYGGLSAEFFDVSQRRHYKHQALDALRLGPGRTDAAFLFPADGLYTDIVLSEALNCCGRPCLELSDLALLAEYDVKNRTDYLSTLEQYLRCNNRLAAAAKALFLDRGTLKYRLQKIRSLVNADFDEPETARLLRLGLAVYRAARAEPGGL